MTARTRSESANFLSAGGNKSTDKIKDLFDNPEFGATAEDRYNYFDELINDNEELQDTLSSHNIEWPSSIEALQAD